VREDVADVQLKRPEVSAATAAVLDRALAKDMRRRYPDAATMARALEDVLAIETSRSGQATGEVTTVLRTLPGGTRRRLPLRLRHPVRWLATLALIAAAVAVALVAALGHTHRGTSTAGGGGARTGLTVVPLSQTAAHGYNPFGTGPENRDLIPNVVDNDPTTTWSTEQYYEGTLKKPGGTGLGLYLDAAPGVAAKALQIKTPTPGFAVQVYAARQFDATPAYGNSTPLTARGWVGPLGESSFVHDGERIPLRTAGQTYRYYLMWMTTLPQRRITAEVNELTLLR
jgi:eukaryotic-like serine/threonine-protein kinase